MTSDGSSNSGKGLQTQSADGAKSTQYCPECQRALRPDGKCGNEECPFYNQVPTRA